MFCCKHCGQEFETARKRGLHQRCCSMSPDYERLKLARQRGARMTAANNKGKRLVKRTRYVLHCERCGAEFVKEMTDSQYARMKFVFCSRACANARQHSDETKQKIAASICKYNESRQTESNLTAKVNGQKVKLTKPDHCCVDCGVNISPNATRCKLCANAYRVNRLKSADGELTRCKLRQAGLKSVSVQSERRRSKNEINFCSLCEQNFNHVEHNKPIFNGWDADVIIHDIKVAVLWNGRWHYEQIKKSQSVAQVQNRDKIKIGEIERAGYTPYVIKDMGKASEKKVNTEFEIFLNWTKTLDAE